jgi:tRNA(Leu) C34 or U34 (ribose-2'-O)-methylase TrmL
VSRRGYYGVGLINPKTHINVGSVMRAATCFGAAFVAAQNVRYKPAPTDTMHYARHAPLHLTDDIFALLPYDCEPVAVDLIEGAEQLPTFVHKPRAFYIFGPEDGTLGKAVTARCARTLVIPSLACLNLAMAVNVVLYDRFTKEN